MAYNKKIWKNGDIITEQNINRIETGISEAHNEIETLNKEIVKYKKIKLYNTYGDMKQDQNLNIGDICKTLGYYNIGDDGGAEYIINNKTESIINKSLDNNLKAQLIIDNSKGIVLETVGIIPDSLEHIEHNSLIFKELAIFALNKHQLFLNPKKYWISNLDMSDVTNFELALLGSNKNISQNGKKSTIATNGGNFITTQNTGIFIQAENIVFTSGVTDNIPRGTCFGSFDANDQEVNFNFINVWFDKFDKAFYSPSWSCNSKGKNINISNCHTGIYVGMASHTLEIDQISLNHNVCGIYLNWGGNFSELKNVHIATGYYMNDENEFNELVAISSGGGSIIRGIYYEPYITTSTEKQILIDYNGYGYGVKGLYVYDADISYPGANNTGLFLRGRTKTGDHQSKWFYPDGCVHFINCTYDITTLKEVVNIYQNSTNELTQSWFGYSINGKQFIENGIGCGRNLMLYVNTTADNLTFNVTPQDTYYMFDNYSDIDMGKGFKNTYIEDKDVYDISNIGRTGYGTVRIKGMVLLNNITPQTGVIRIMTTSGDNIQDYGPNIPIVDLNDPIGNTGDARRVIPFEFEFKPSELMFNDLNWYGDAVYLNCSEQITEENKPKIKFIYTVEFDEVQNKHLS